LSNNPNANDVKVRPADVVQIVTTLLAVCAQHPSDLVIRSAVPNEKGEIEMPMIMVTVPALRQLLAAVCAYHNLFEQILTGDGAQAENIDLTMAEWETTIAIMQRALRDHDADAIGVDAYAPRADRFGTPIRPDDDLELTISGSTFRDMLALAGVK
jgi:hypothetical protein